MKHQMQKKTLTAMFQVAVSRSACLLPSCLCEEPTLLLGLVHEHLKQFTVPLSGGTDLLYLILYTAHVESTCCRRKEMSVLCAQISKDVQSSIFSILGCLQLAGHVKSASAGWVLLVVAVLCSNWGVSRI